MGRFHIREAVTQYAEDLRSVLVSAVFAGPSGKYEMHLRVMRDGLVEFESLRLIHFIDQAARIAIKPLVGVPRDYGGELHLSIDGEALPVISLLVDG